MYVTVSPSPSATTTVSTGARKALAEASPERKPEMRATPNSSLGNWLVAGALLTGIKSDLPGDVIATVTAPVYDTATGRFLLIPQGSRILGRYNSQVSYGHRSSEAWKEISLSTLLGAQRQLHASFAR